MISGKNSAKNQECRFHSRVIRKTRNSAVPKSIKVPLNDDQFERAMKLLDKWNEGPKTQDLIYLNEDGLTDEEKEKEIIDLQVSRSITYDLWKEFCEEVEIELPFPVF